MGFILAELFFAAVGRLCLLIWYRDIAKVEKIKNERYAGLYSGAGRVFVLNFVAGVGAVVMLSAAMYFLFSWIYKSITN